jgi:hypothetical protein
MLGDSTARPNSKSHEAGGALTEPKPPSPTPDDSMTEKEKDDMVDQMEEFEGPDRREDRGNNEPPNPEDPGVASS